MANLQPLLEISLNNVRLSDSEDFVVGMPVFTEVSVPLAEPISCLAVGVGAAGNNVLETLSQGDDVKSLSVLAHGLTYQRSRIGNKLLVGAAMLKGGGAHGDRQLASSAIGADLTVLNESVSGNDLVFVIAGMAKGTGGGVGPAIAKMVSEHQGLPIGVAIMPFAHSGPTMASRANESLRLLQQECPAIVKFYNEAICVRHPNALSKELLDKANAAIAAIVSTLREAASSFSADGNSFADFKQHFLRGTNLLVASCMVEANVSPKEQIQAVLANSLTGSDIAGAASSILVLTSKKGVQFSHLDRLKVQMGAAANNIHHVCSITERYDPAMPANTLRLSIICSMKGELRQALAPVSAHDGPGRLANAEGRRLGKTPSLTDAIKERMQAANISSAAEEVARTATGPRNSTAPPVLTSPKPEDAFPNKQGVARTTVPADRLLNS